MPLLQMRFTENKKFAHITQKVKNTGYEPRFVQPQILIFIHYTILISMRKNLNFLNIKKIEITSEKKININIVLEYKKWNYPMPNMWDSNWAAKVWENI